MRPRLLRLATLLLPGLALALVLQTLPVRGAFDREGYSRNPSLLSWLLEALGAPGVVEATYTQSPIKTLQYGAVALGSATSNTATLSTSVTVANSVVIPEGYDIGGGTNANVFMAYLTLTNTNTVTAARNTSAVDSLSFKFCVVEFRGGALNSAPQDFSIAIAGGASTNTAPVTSVSTTKTLLVHRGSKYDTANADLSFSYVSLVQTSATVITGTRNSNTGVATAYGTVVEFK